MRAAASHDASAAYAPPNRQEFITQRPMLSRRNGKKGDGKKRRKKKPDAVGDEEDITSRAAGGSSSEVVQLREELRDALEMLEREAEHSDLMQQTAELALRALDAHLSDGKWSTFVSPPAGSQPGKSFQWQDLSNGINSTAVTLSDARDADAIVQSSRAARAARAHRLTPPTSPR